VEAPAAAAADATAAAATRAASAVVACGSGGAEADASAAAANLEPDAASTSDQAVDKAKEKAEKGGQKVLACTLEQLVGIGIDEAQIVQMVQHILRQLLRQDQRPPGATGAAAAAIAGATVAAANAAAPAPAQAATASVVNAAAVHESRAKWCNERLGAVLCVFN
jgi:hypothetical protein